MEYTTKIPVRGRLGTKRSEASARIVCNPEEWKCARIRIDDANNLEFWCEFEIPANVILEMAECIKKSNK